MDGKPPPPAIIRIGTWSLVEDNILHMHVFLNVAYGGEDGNFTFHSENPQSPGEYSKVWIEVSQWSDGVAIDPVTTRIKDRTYMRPIWRKIVGGAENRAQLPSPEQWVPAPGQTEAGVLLYNEPLENKDLPSSSFQWGVYEITGTLFFSHDNHPDDIHRVEFGSITLRGATGLY